MGPAACRRRASRCLQKNSFGFGGRLGYHVRAPRSGASHRVHLCMFASRVAWLRSCVITDLACHRRRWQRLARRRFSCSSLHPRPSATLFKLTGPIRIPCSVVPPPLRRRLRIVSVPFSPSSAPSFWASHRTRCLAHPPSWCSGPCGSSARYELSLYRVRHCGPRLSTLVVPVFTDTVVMVVMVVMVGMVGVGMEVVVTGGVAGGGVTVVGWQSGNVPARCPDHIGHGIGLGENPRRVRQRSSGTTPHGTRRLSERSAVSTRGLGESSAAVKRRWALGYIWGTAPTRSAIDVPAPPLAQFCPQCHG